MDYILKQHKKGRKYSKYILGGDVGGTNTNLGISGIKKGKPELLFSMHFKTQELKSLVSAINTILNYAKNNNIHVNHACIAVAGIVNNYSTSNLTNVKWKINIREILKKTQLKSAFVMNDFQAIGYSVNILNKKDFNKIRHKGHKHSEVKGKPKAIIGAGTGLGVSLLVYDKNFKTYIPIASEGGHGDFPVYDEFDFKLINFIRKKRNIKKNISYEQLLSGRGIENIYSYLRSLKKYASTKYTKEIDKSKDKPKLISQYRTKDKLCKETFRLFAKYYARCAKNFTLDVLAKGGLYIAGGIAAKNKDIFKSKDFMKEFEYTHKQAESLYQTPIYLITNYDISLIGACYAGIIRKDLMRK